MEYKVGKEQKHRVETQISNDKTSESESTRARRTAKERNRDYIDSWIY